MKNQCLNCIIVDDEAFSRTIISEMVKETALLNLVQECASAAEAFQVLSTEAIDIMFLDIEMPGMTGLELINNIETQPVVILITGKACYAAQSYDYEVTDFVVKPVTPNRFMKALSRATKACQETKPSTPKGEVFVKSDGKLVRINTSEILWIESLGNYVKIRLQDTEVLVLSTMKDMEQRMPTEDLIRIHRYYIVNKSKIIAIEENAVQIEEQFFPISKSNREYFFSSLNQF